MKVRIDRDELLKVLQKVHGTASASRQNTLPVLAGVLISAGTDGMVFATTDLEMFIQGKVDAIIEKEGSCVVNARKLFEIVKELDTDTVEVHTATEKLVLKSGRSRFNLQMLPVEDFPSLPLPEGVKFDEVPGGVIVDMIEKTCFSVSHDTMRYNINGFYIENNGSRTRLVTTDGHRLSIVEKDFSISRSGVLLPYRGMMELKKLLQSAESISVGITGDRAVFRCDEYLVVFRLLEGTFPEYRGIIPSDNNTVLVTDRELLLSALKRVSVLSSHDRIRGVRFELSEKKLRLSVSNQEMGDAEEEIEVEYEGEDFCIAFNARYLVEIFDAMYDERIVIRFKDDMSPALITPLSNKESTYLVMPMRLLE